MSLSSHFLGRKAPDCGVAVPFDCATTRSNSCDSILPPAKLLIVEYKYMYRSLKSIQPQSI
jgi:hypothetical protein